MKLRSGIFGVILLVLGGMCYSEAIDVGNRLELFVDSHLVDSMSGARLELHHPVPRETVLQFDKPWEGAHAGYATIILDGDKYRLYYRGLPAGNSDGSAAECTCYAESGDGIHFTKPDLGMFEVFGTKENNVILSGMAPLSHNFSPFLDTNPAAKPDERYKAFAGISSNGGLVPFASADGIHWRKLRHAPVITKGAFDSQNIAFWSEAEKCYVSYFRFFTQDGFRSINRATSQDFLNWTEPVEMTFGDTPREHLYTNQTRPYYRAPHIYVATAARFMQGRRVLSDEEAVSLGAEGRSARDCSDTVLMTTRGGSRYDRTFMEGFVRPGIGAGNWITRTNYPAHGIVPTGETEMSMYVQRNYGQPTHSLQRLAIRVDGFASIKGPYSGGEAVTKPIRFEGKKLYVNYSTSAAGGVWVELLDEGGKPIEGFARADADEIVGDEISRVVTWNGKSDVSALAGKVVRVKFAVKDADVYSMRFGE